MGNTSNDSIKSKSEGMRVKLRFRLSAVMSIFILIEPRRANEWKERS